MDYSHCYCCLCCYDQYVFWLSFDLLWVTAWLTKQRTTTSTLKSNRQQGQDSLETGSPECDSCGEEGYNSTLSPRVKIYPQTRALWDWWPCCSVRCRASMHLFWHNEISVLQPSATENTAQGYAHTDYPGLFLTCLFELIYFVQW